MRRRLLLAILLLGCDDGGSSHDADPAVDATVPDSSSADAARDAAPDSAPPVPDAARDAARDAAPDARPLDAAPSPVDARPLDGAPDGPEPPPVDYGPEADAAPLPPCPELPALPPAPPGGRWLLSMFHFNVQYVAGGLDGFAEAALANAELAPRTDRSEREVEDQIIRESYAPLLGILERHPDLALTTELQGYMIDIIRERHPGLLARMQALTASGQLELASIHWSDQFFLAFGRADMDESWRLTQASFAAAGLPVSRAVFTQEGQFGEGFADWLASVRPDAVMIMPRNLAGFYRGDLVEAPLFKVGALDVVLPRGLRDGLVERNWSFFDDGELLATNGQNPYFASTFLHDTLAVRDYEHQLRCAADAGWRVGRVADYADAVRAQGYEPQQLGPFIDGTWQPGSTRGPSRWMGMGGLYKRHEQDNAVLTTCTLARARVLALQIVDPAHDRLDDAWRHLLLGEVSDARGINPWRGEVQYGLRHCGRARELATNALEAWVDANGGGYLRVDTLTGEAQPLEGIENPGVQEPVDPPFEVRVEAHGGRPYTISWTVHEDLSGQRPPGSAANPVTLTVEWQPQPDLAERHANCIAAGRTDIECALSQPAVEISFPRAAGAMIYRPALGSSLLRRAEADFAFSGDAARDGVWFPAADGLIGLGGDRFLIKDVQSVHLAYGWVGDGSDRIRLRDETLPPQERAVWRFWFADDEATALELADRNLHPLVDVIP